MQTVELRTACQSWCEDCGSNNFAMPQKAELTDTERENAFRTFHDMEPFEQLPEGWKDFEMVYRPDTVTCEGCKSTFSAIDERTA